MLDISNHTEPNFTEFVFPIFLMAFNSGTYNNIQVINDTVVKETICDALNFFTTVKNNVSIDRIQEVMCLVGLDPDNKKHVSKLSMGMRQRLGIAQAIMEDPSLLILDEPFNGLDANGIEDMRNLLLDQKEQGKTILMASHSSEDIKCLCDNVIRMEQGRIT